MTVMPAMASPGQALPLERDRAELAVQPEPVVLDPVLDHLAVGEAADDDDGPPRRVARGGYPLPNTALGRPPAPAPDAAIAGAEEVVQGVVSIRKGGEEADHPLPPGRQSPQRLLAHPVRGKILGPVLLQSVEVVAVEDLFDVRADHRLVLACWHGVVSLRYMISKRPFLWPEL